MQRRIAIVGAGVTGLVAARELARRGHKVTLYERWPDVGGQASAFDVGGGVLVERYYHHLFRSDRDMIDLHEELLPGCLEWHRSSVAMYSRGRIWPFTSPRDLLTYAPLPRIDRIRLGLAVMRLVRRADWQRMDDLSALAWLRSASGARALAEVWTPLMLGKFGRDAERVPLAWLWSKLVLRRQKLAGRGARVEELGYPAGSFQAICRALAQDIERLGGSILLDREVVRVRSEGGEGLILDCASPGAYRRPFGTSEPLAQLQGRAELILLTTPTGITDRLAEWPVTFRSQLRAWRYRTAIVLLLELRDPFSNTYWLNVADASIPFLGLIEHTNFVPAERYPARYLYVSNYVANDDPISRLTTDQLLVRYLPALRRIKPAFGEHSVARAWSFHEEAAQPIPEIGNRNRVLPHHTPLQGIYIANTTQIYPEDRGTNYSVVLGKNVAREIIDAT
jgi:protoporphyrinogen oxidase